MDWNHDGRKDLITGERYGYIRIYLNTGTDENPEFNGFTYLQVGGSDFDCGSSSIPEIVDWNNDGLPDLLCGEDSGIIFLLINVGKPEDPCFEEYALIQNGAGNMDVGYYAAPAVVDWNKDGMKDLIVGNRNANLLYFENLGSDTEPNFNGSEQLYAGGELIDLGYGSRPEIADWDEDGQLDILCGNRELSPLIGYIRFFKAKGALLISDNRIFAKKGGIIDFRLKAGQEFGGEEYIILGSASGTYPGVPLGNGMVLPLNWDAFSNLALSMVNSLVFPNFRRALSKSGTGMGAFNTQGPLPEEAIGLNLSFAFVLYKPHVHYVSNAVNMEIVK